MLWQVLEECILPAPKTTGLQEQELNSQDLGKEGLKWVFSKACISAGGQTPASAVACCI